MTMKNKLHAIPAHRALQRMVNQHVGGQIKCLRRHHREPLDTFGHVLDVTGQQISRFEHGDHRISAAQLYLIAHSTNTPIQWFFTGLQKSELRRQIPVIADANKVNEPRIAADLYQENARMEDLAWSFKTIKSATVKNLFTELARQIACESGRS